jgi:hypothetical protein
MSLERVLSLVSSYARKMRAAGLIPLQVLGMLLLCVSFLKAAGPVE